MYCVALSCVVLSNTYLLTYQTHPYIKIMKQNKISLNNKITTTFAIKHAPHMVAKLTNMYA